MDFLRANANIFAWSPSDMPDIPREVVEHALDILPHSHAVQQRLRRFDEERHRAIGVELRKLLVAGFIKEVFHPTWLANPLLVKKKNGKWRMCVDYTILNKACPKVPFFGHESIKSLTRQQGVNSYAFLMPLPGTTK
jgi:hypothetical protein